MPSQQYDVLQLDDLNLPYDRRTKELSDMPRLVDGNNAMVFDGKIRKRPAFVRGDFTASVGIAFSRIERLVYYETLENPSKIYILASMFSPGQGYYMFYLRIDGTNTWTQFPNIRGMNQSTVPHEIVVSNGLAYIRGVPINAATDAFGTAVFDGTDASTKFWGLLRPTISATPTSQAGWSATTSTVVKSGWHYASSFVTSTGQVSSRSLTGAPVGQGSISSSSTGPFTNKIPRVTVQGSTDTTNIPTIRMWRTYDGGGNFVFLEDVVNPGTGSFTYIDDQFGGKPMPDSQMDPNNLAPSTTSNDPPPPVIYPDVIGTDDPRPGSHIVEFAGRLWYMIDNILAFSGNEEIINGSPRECFVSGGRGNFIRFKTVGRYLGVSNEALYIVTDNQVFWLRGNDRKSFFIKALFDKIGGSQFRSASTVIADQMIFLTPDYEVVVASGAQGYRYLSGPLKADITSRINTDVEITFGSHQVAGGFWLIVALHDRGTPANSKVWVFDVQRGAWNTPWSIPVTAILNSRIRETDLQSRLLFATYDGTTTRIVEADFDSSTDGWAASTAPFAIDFTFNLVRNPGGNHLNLLRRPGHHSRLAFVKTERTKFVSDTVPVLEYRLDDFSAALTAATAKDPPYIHQSTSHVINWWPVAKNMQRVQVKISKTALAENFELQTYGLIFQPEAGE